MEQKHTDGLVQARSTQADDFMPDTIGMNFFEQDKNLSLVLRKYLSNEEFEKIILHLSELGSVAGDELDRLSRLADKNTPQLVQYNAKGERIDEVEYHPSYRQMEYLGYSKFGLVAMSHRPGVMGWTTKLPHVIKYAFWYLFVQSEFGLCCPMSMTDSAARVIEKFAAPEIKEKYLPHLSSLEMDDLWTAAMFMTEKQGGSDVGANTVVAKQNGDSWELWGDKWFCSNVSAEVALVLARPEGAPAGTKGLGLFLVPRTLPNGSRNKYRVNRLKDKFGTRDMASGEVTFEAATAYVIGDLSKGFKQMMTMVNSSRLSNAVRSTGMMRRSWLEAIVTARGRTAFGKTLAELPLMRETLLELMLDSEVATSVIIHTAHVYDLADNGSRENEVLLRLLTPILKGYICKRARYDAAESMEVRGGNGYIEDWINPKLVRDTHLGAIWEGTTNIMALDILRALVKNGAGEVYFNNLYNIIPESKDGLIKQVSAFFKTIIRKIDEQSKRIVAISGPSREVPAKALMNRMYHLLACSLLLSEAEREVSTEGNYRKLYLTLQYVQRHLLSNGYDDLIFANQSLMDCFDAIVDWGTVPGTAIEALLEEIDFG